MARDSLPPTLFALGTIPATQAGGIEEIMHLVERRAEVVALQRSAHERLAEAQAMVASAHQPEIETLHDQQTELDRRLTALLILHKRAFTNRFGKVAELPGGVVRYRRDAKSLDTPKSVTAIINFLLMMRGGKRYLTLKWSLNRDALTQANASLLRKLRPLGVRVARHDIITIKSDGQDEPTTLSRRPYREPKKS